MQLSFYPADCRAATAALAVFPALTPISKLRVPSKFAASPTFGSRPSFRPRRAAPTPPAPPSTGDEQDPAAAFGAPAAPPRPVALLLAMRNRTRAASTSIKTACRGTAVSTRAQRAISWRRLVAQKGGVTAELTAQVEAELRAALGAPPAAPAPEVPRTNPPGPAGSAGTRPAPPAPVPADPMWPGCARAYAARCPHGIWLPLPLSAASAPATDFASLMRKITG